MGDIQNRLSEMIDNLIPEAPLNGQQLWVDGMVIDLPFELHVRQNKTGELAIEATAPTQTYETTIMPVFHRVKVHIIIGEDEHP
jgi:hypothetical protein